jgi:hypothetical protein
VATTPTKAPAKAPDVRSKGPSSRSVKVTGLAEITADFRAMGPGLQEAITKLTPDIAQYVYRITTGAASTSAERKAVGGIKLSGSAVILGNGNDRAGRMAVGTEFGGRRRRHTMQFRPHKGREGYFFWPAMRSHSTEIKKMWDDMLDRLISG